MCNIDFSNNLQYNVFLNKNELFKFLCYLIDSLKRPNINFNYYILIIY